MEYGAVLHSPYYTLPEGMKFTLVVFSCKQYVDIVAARSSHSTRTVYNIALEPGTGTGLCNEIPGLYDKISITIVPSYTGNISLVCRLRHCYSCFALVTILRQQTRDIFRYSLVLW